MGTVNIRVEVETRNRINALCKFLKDKHRKGVNQTEAIEHLFKKRTEVGTEKTKVEARDKTIKELELKVATLTKATPVQALGKYPPIQECGFFSEYPSKPEYVRCRKDGFWKIVKLTECKACSQHSLLNIDEEMKQHNKLKAMIDSEGHHLVELQSQRTRLNEEIRLLKDKVKPPTIDPKETKKLKARIIELEQALKDKPQALDSNARIIKLEQELKIMTRDKIDACKSYNALLMEGYNEEKGELHLEIDKAFMGWGFERSMPKNLRVLLKKDGSLLDMKR